MRNSFLRYREKQKRYEYKAPPPINYNIFGWNHLRKLIEGSNEIKLSGKGHLEIRNKSTSLASSRAIIWALIRDHSIFKTEKGPVRYQLFRQVNDISSASVNYLLVFYYIFTRLKSSMCTFFSEYRRYWNFFLTIIREIVHTWSACGQLNSCVNLKFFKIFSRERHTRFGLVVTEDGTYIVFRSTTCWSQKYLLCNLEYLYLFISLLRGI